ncbi:ribonuclease III [Williamsoniiplasma lucivorax]|uniref:Ribonuclease 3 n=1 Tax=Williamsoniiplasma lucivorax TaxID=209274 RepID=A0A2S5RAC8_9MOLU|nr:ribonuclease III [Williamsoniiplasma lucivorax]PPE04075.1 ribonuclease III [Williamsoniiplasma lucivorax]
MTLDEFLLQYDIKINNRRLFDEALTHNSYSNEKHLKYTYQRLEFLGDSLLQMYVSLYYFHNFPKLKEGVLTKSRSNVVREESLALVARKIKLGNYIRLGQGEYDSKGYDKDSILSDVFESFTAAIYLDQGEEVTLNWLRKTLFKFMNSEEFLEKTKDYKSELQELLQASKRTDLTYIVDSENHNEAESKIEYTISVYLENQKLGTGVGFSKQQAEQKAAKDSLSKLKLR